MRAEWQVVFGLNSIFFAVQPENQSQRSLDDDEIHGQAGNDEHKK